MVRMLDQFFSLFSHDIGFDLGTANTLVFVRGKGIVIREPSMVTIQKKTKQVIAVGNEAKRMLGKTPINLTVIKPLRDGVISDFDITATMLSIFIQKVHEVGSLFPRLARPRVVLGIPSGVTEVERRAVWEAALSAGARSAFLIEEPMAAAIGAGLDIEKPTGLMLVDIGGGTTEIAVISLGGIVISRSLRIAGAEMDEAIANYMRLRHGILLGEQTAEELKIQTGSVYKEKNTTDRMAIIRGRDIETGLPRSLKVSETEVREALAPIASLIVEAIVETLEETPPELTSDILEHGIILTGGGALLAGLDKLILERTKMSVFVTDDPLTTVVRGTGRVLEDDHLLARVKVTGGLV